MNSRRKSRTPSTNPLRVSPGFRQYVLGQLEPIRGVVSRPMFGGVGLYCEDVFFGIVAGDVLYLKVDERTRRDYEAAGMEPFKPYPHRSGTMQYYAVPAGVLESPEELERWVRKAVDVAERQRAESQR